MITLRKILTSIGFALAALSLFTISDVFAADCANFPIGGDYTVTASCNIPDDGTGNGDDGGVDAADSGGRNGGDLIINNGATLTLTTTAGKNVAFGTITINTGGSIAINNGTSLRNTRIWMTDADSDGYPATLNQMLQDSAPTNGRRRYLMNALTADENDANASCAPTCYSEGYYQGYYEAYYYSEGYYEGYYYNYPGEGYYEGYYYNYPGEGYYEGYYYNYPGEGYYYNYPGEGYYYNYPGEGYYYNYPGEGYYYNYPGEGYYEGGYGCFISGTKVLMADGSTKEIQNIKQGDKILSYNLATGKTVPDSVKELLVHTNHQGGYLIINGNLKVTGEHRMWLANRNEWNRAETLKVGDQFINKNGQKVAIFSIENVAGEYTVYNLKLGGENHNYFAENILVHNEK